MYLSEAMAKAHMVPAQLAMWLPNLVLGGIGVALIAARSRWAEAQFKWPSAVRRLWRRRNPEQVVVSGPKGKNVVVVIRFPQLSIPGPTILDRYVTGLYLRVFTIAFVGIVGIFNLSTFIDLSDKLFKGETTGGMMLAFFWFQNPQFVYYSLPIAALIAALVCVGLLTKSSELVVMGACGISLYRTAAPLLGIAMIWSATLFLLSEHILVHSNRRAAELNSRIRGGSARTFDLMNRKWIIGRAGEIYHYAFFDPARIELNAVSVYGIEPKGWNLSKRTFATRAAYTTSGWLGYNGWTREFGAGAEPKTYRAFNDQPLPLESPEFFVTEEPDAERMSYQQLKNYIAELRATGFNVVPYTVALQRKVSFPFVTLVMTLLAIPFAVTTGNRGALYGVGIGLVLAIGYWTLFSVFAAIGSAGLVTPTLAAWAPNIMFATAAAYLLLTVRT
jgi:LPS export ABC transporter permease LptG